MAKSFAHWTVSERCKMPGAINMASIDDWSTNASTMAHHCRYDTMLQGPRDKDLAARTMFRPKSLPDHTGSPDGEAQALIRKEAPTEIASGSHRIAGSGSYVGAAVGVAVGYRARNVDSVPYLSRSRLIPARANLSRGNVAWSRRPIGLSETHSGPLVNTQSSSAVLA